MHGFLTGRADPRAIYVEARAEDLYKELVAQCPMCFGVGRHYSNLYDPTVAQFASCPCNCKRLFYQMVDLMIAGVQEGTARELCYSRLWERRVVEFDPRTKEHLEPSYLIHDHIDPYMRSHRKVVENGYSYLFVGVNSVGKTFVAMKVLRHLLKKGYSGHFIKFRKLMKLINNSITSNSKDKQHAIFLVNKIANVDFLIVDELGKETGSSEHVSAEIEELLKDRDHGLKPTIVITNTDFDELQNLYTVNIVGAFLRNYRILVFNPNDNMRLQARSAWEL